MGEAFETCQEKMKFIIMSVNCFSPDSDLI